MMMTIGQKSNKIGPFRPASLLPILKRRLKNAFVAADPKLPCQRFPQTSVWPHVASFADTGKR